MRWNQWNWTACKHVGELLEKLEMLQKGMKILNSLGRVLKKRKAKGYIIQEKEIYQEAQSLYLS